MSELLMLAEEIRKLQRRLDRLEAQESGSGVTDHGALTGRDDDDHTLYLLATGARTGATSEAQNFAKQAYAPDFLPAVSSDADSQQFNAGAAGTPAGWTEVDAPVNSTQALRLGWWRITGSSSNTAWSYRNQMAALNGSSAFNSFALGPCFFRDGRWAGDLTYRVGIYADNAGVPNANVFVRVNLTWDSAASIWKARSERKDGSAQTDGSWFNLGQIPIAQPVWMRVVIRTTATISARAYIGGVAVYDAHTLLQDAAANYTWGTPWAVVELASRPASGVDDYFYAAALNRTGDV